MGRGTCVLGGQKGFLEEIGMEVGSADQTSGSYWDLALMSHVENTWNNDITFLFCNAAIAETCIYQTLTVTT